MWIQTLDADIVKQYVKDPDTKDNGALFFSPVISKTVSDDLAWNWSQAFCILIT